MKTLLIDFDGTIVEHKFPEIGEPMPNAIRVLKKLQNAGHRMILHTCREDNPNGRKYLSEAIQFCQDNGVEFEKVNEAFEDDFRKDYIENPRKPHCNIHIDDHNFGGFPGWLEVERKLFPEEFYYNPGMAEQINGKNTSRPYE